MHEQNDKLTRIAARRFLQLVQSSGSDYVLTPAGDLVVQPTGGQLIVRQSGGVAGTDDLTLEHDGTDAHIKSLSGDVIVTPTGGQLIVRQPGGVAGTDDVWLYHDGSNGYLTSQSGNLNLAVPDGTVIATFNASSITVFEHIVPSGSRQLGSTSAEWLSLYLGDAGGVYFGADQDYNLAYDEAGDDILKLAGGVAAANGDFELETTRTITGGVTDGYAASLHLDPGYTAATAQTVTRHNYIDLQGVSLAGAGPAALTDACVFRFDAAAGTHKATVGATTKTTPGAVDAWLKVNINGTLYYVPAYTSTTA